MVFSFYASPSRVAPVPHGASALRLLEHRQESVPKAAIGGRSTAAKIFFREASRTSRARTTALHRSPPGPKSNRRPTPETLEQQLSCQRHRLRWWLRSNFPSTARVVRQMLRPAAVADKIPDGAFAAPAKPTDSLGQVLASFPRTLAPIAPNLMLFPRGWALGLVMPPSLHNQGTGSTCWRRRSPDHRQTLCRHPWVLARLPWLPCWRLTRGSSRGWCRRYDTNPDSIGENLPKVLLQDLAFCSCHKSNAASTCFNSLTFSGCVTAATRIEGRVLQVPQVEDLCSG